MHIASMIRASQSSAMVQGAAVYRLGPKKEKGEVRSEKTGSQRTLKPRSEARLLVCIMKPA